MNLENGTLFIYNVRYDKNTKTVMIIARRYPSSCFCSCFGCQVIFKIDKNQDDLCVRTGTQFYTKHENNHIRRLKFKLSAHCPPIFTQFRVLLLCINFVRGSSDHRENVCFSTMFCAWFSTVHKKKIDPIT